MSNNEKKSDQTKTQETALLPIVLKESSKLAVQDSLRLYLQEINKFSILEPEEEYELAKQVRLNNDKQAAFRLISSHLRLVVRIAMDFQRHWMKNVLDLIQEGNVGLMKAVQKFDPERGIKFSYYASFWIKAYIRKFTMDNWRMVKIGTTQAQRKLFYNFNKETQRLKNLGHDPSTANISKNLNVSKKDVVEMSQRLNQQDLSLDLPIGDNADGASRLDFIPALGEGIEESLAREEMQDALHENIKHLLPKLNAKEADILNERLLSDTPVTLREIGEKYGITRERIRQIEARLLQKIKEQMTRNVNDFSRDWIQDE